MSTNIAGKPKRQKTNDDSSATAEGTSKSCKKRHNIGPRECCVPRLYLWRICWERTSQKGNACRRWKKCRTVALPSAGRHTQPTGTEHPAILSRKSSYPSSNITSALYTTKPFCVHFTIVSTKLNVPTTQSVLTVVAVVVLSIRRGRQVSLHGCLSSVSTPKAAGVTRHMTLTDYGFARLVDESNSNLILNKPCYLLTCDFCHKIVRFFIIF